MPRLSPRAGVRCGAGLDTAYGRWLQDAIARGNLLDSQGNSTRLPQRPRVREVEVPSGLSAPPLPSEWLDPSRYRLVASRRWRWGSEHINVKEARAAVSSLRHAARQGACFGHRIICLCDSLVALGALEKGRSSRSLGLNAQCRRAAAYAIGCQLQVRWRYIASADNPADAPHAFSMPSCLGTAAAYSAATAVASSAWPYQFCVFLFYASACAGGWRGWCRLLSAASGVVSSVAACRARARRPRLSRA